MSRIAFFNIPAHGHPNPTIEIVRALTQKVQPLVYISLGTVIKDAAFLRER